MGINRYKYLFKLTVPIGRYVISRSKREKLAFKELYKRLGWRWKINSVILFDGPVDNDTWVFYAAFETTQTTRKFLFNKFSGTGIVAEILPFSPFEAEVVVEMK